MGCEVQVHKKSDSQGTWAFHSVDGWYLATSPEHYRTHLCHIKSTHSKKLSDTVHFKHKNITNLSLSHADKIMKAIADLANVLKRKPLVMAQQEQEIHDLTQLVEATSLQGTLPGVPNQNKNATVLRVQPKATLPRVPELTPGKITRITPSKKIVPDNSR